jgi:hypothetical protein
MLDSSIEVDPIGQNGLRVATVSRISSSVNPETGIFMWLRLYNLINRLATWPVVVLLLAGLILCALGFAWRQTKLGMQTRLLDTRIFDIYTPEDVRELFDALTKQGRQLYAATQLSLDIIFPILYASLIAILLVWLYDGEIEKKVIILPLLAMSADLLENITVAYLAITYNEKESVLAWASSIFTATKWALLFICAIALVIGVLSKIQVSSQ